MQAMNKWSIVQFKYKGGGGEEEKKKKLFLYLFFFFFINAAQCRVWIFFPQKWSKLFKKNFFSFFRRIIIQRFFFFFLRNWTSSLCCIFFFFFFTLFSVGPFSGLLSDILSVRTGRSVYNVNLSVIWLSGK